MTRSHVRFDCALRRTSLLPLCPRILQRRAQRQQRQRDGHSRCQRQHCHGTHLLLAAATAIVEGHMSLPCHWPVSSGGSALCHASMHITTSLRLVLPRAVCSCISSCRQAPSIASRLTSKPASRNASAANRFVSLASSDDPAAYVSQRISYQHELQTSADRGEAAACTCHEILSSSSYCGLISSWLFPLESSTSFLQCSVRKGRCPAENALFLLPKRC